VLTRRVGVIAGIVCASLAAAGSAQADDGPIVVSPAGPMWIKTTVTQAGIVATSGVKHRTSRRTCTQHKSNTAGSYASADQFTGDYPDAGPGGWVIRRCSDGSMDMAYVPAPTDSVAEVAKRLAQDATNRLPLPLPQPKFNPSRPSSAGPATLVAIPTWFWVDGWRPVTQRTQAGGVWAEVVAAPVAATWFPGDGTAPVRCAANEAWSSDAAPTSCEHVYARSSAGQPSNSYTARVIVTWQVRWTGSGGRSGTLPLMQRQSTFPIAVAERQTVVTVGGSQ